LLLVSLLAVVQYYYIGLYDDIITNCNALLNCRICTYGTIFANNNGFGNGATIGNVLTVNLSTNMDAINITIGANTVIDRGTLEDTQIHHGVRLDNLVHIAHNVILGADTAIAADVGK
jgi:UDP-3-O-[3-hydroxymyristoyl] glucosamine N-acyltransferase